MPASSIELFHMQDAKNNFDAIRPAPVFGETNHIIADYQNIHISRNCYYGYHDAKSSGNVPNNTDCEMKEVPLAIGTRGSESNAKKRCADHCVYSQSKRMREEVQKEKNIEPETTENTRFCKNSEDLLENLYWNIHGGHMFQLLQCL